MAPVLAVPLPEPSILRYGVRAVLTPGSPVRLSGLGDKELVRFMAVLARHCTAERFERAMAGYRPLDARVFAAFERQERAGVATGLVEADVLSCFEGAAGRRALVQEINGLVEAAQPVGLDLLTGDEARRIEPHLSERIDAVVRIRQQRFLTPSSYVLALADSVRRRGGKILDDIDVSDLSRRGEVVVALSSDGEIEADAAVIATGARLSRLASAHGVEVPVFGGRGYSFTVPCAEPFSSPIHFPSARVAVTPQGDRGRIGGIMEFANPDRQPTPGVIETMVRASRPLLTGVDWEKRSDDWVGARPVSGDGLPLVGESATPGVFVNGGHGMWGLTLGPLSGELLAAVIMRGVRPSLLEPLDPRRRLRVGLLRRGVVRGRR